MKCSIANCGLCRSKNRPNLTFHRLPRNESRKREWLENIGLENIRPGTKDIFVCSLHFAESAFNKTLNISRLRDDSVPTIFTKTNQQSQLPTLVEQSPSKDNVLDCPQPSTSYDNFETYPLSISNTQDTKTNFELVEALEQLKTLEEKVLQQKKKIKCLNEKVRQQKKKIESFKNIIIQLKEKNLINNEESIVLQQCAGSKDFMQRQILKYKGLPLPKQYSEEIRRFALTLHFYSPKAYDFIRSTYEDCLPHPRTLSKWYQNVDAAPGFCQEAFSTLEAKVKASKEPVICALVIDEMAIRKSLIWDPKTRKFQGRVDIGADIDTDSLEVANQSLVFLLNCVNGKWKLPIAYFLITSLSGDQKAALLLTCLNKCYETGVKVVSVTCDGPASNFSMFNHLGCNLLQMDKTFFYFKDHKIYTFIDPCHAVKLVRNTFGDFKILYDSFGAKIDFNLLEKLVELQESEGLHLGTKITKAHIYFNKQKMKVRLATQLLSESVADALEFCSQKLQIESFEDCEGTIIFIRTLNYVFDVLNSYSVRPPGWKKAMCMNNFGLIEALFSRASNYLETLRFSDGTLVIESQRKTGFIGLIIDMKSAMALFVNLVLENSILVYLPIYKFSQDHIELFFSAIRARGGFNNNPNAVQFRAAFKRLLIRAEIRDSGIGSCIPLEQVNILTCSSNIDPVTTLNDLTDKKALVEVQEDDSELFEEYLDCLNSNISKYSESVVSYIAGFVARKLSRTLKCSVCESLLRGDPHDYKKSLIAYKTHGGLIYPSKELENLCLKTEKILKSNLKKSHGEKYYLYIFSFLLENSEEWSKIFTSESNEHNSIHKLLLIKSVIKTYLDIRFRYFGKKMTEKISFRNYFNKIILFRNE